MQVLVQWLEWTCGLFGFGFCGCASENIPSSGFWVRGRCSDVRESGSDFKVFACRELSEGLCFFVKGVLLIGFLVRFKSDNNSSNNNSN